MLLVTAVWFLVGDDTYPLSDELATTLAEDLFRLEPDSEGEGRSTARLIERALVDPASGAVGGTRGERIELMKKLDRMVTGRNRQVAVLLRALRRELGYGESPALDTMIDEQDAPGS